MAIKSETPLGLCPKCSRPLLRMDGVPSCPVHSIAAGTPSNLVVKTEVNPDDYKLIINARGYPEQVLSDDPRPSATPDQLSKVKADVVQNQTTVAIPMVPIPGGTLKVPFSLLVQGLPSETTLEVKLDESQMLSLYELIDTLPPPASMKETRVLVKLQDEIDRLLGR